MSKRAAVRLFGSLAVVLVAALALGASTQARGHHRHGHHHKVYFADLFGGATPHPQAIFFTANAGPQVTDIQWRHWGKRRAVGRGHYKDTSSVPCPPRCHPEGPARIVLRNPRPCKQPKWSDNAGEKLYMYAKGRLTHPDTDTGETTVHSDIGGYSSYCSA